MLTLSEKSPRWWLFAALKTLILLVLVWGVYRMVDIAFPYLLPPYPTNIDFLQSKQTVIRRSLEIAIPTGGGSYFTLLSIPYLWAFYVHITTSVVVLATGITQFSRTLMYRKPRIHRLFGKIYVFTLLLLAAPSGLVMAFFGNGGVPAQLGFVMQSLCWWFLTYMAYRKVRQGQLREHGEFMLRSYALSFSAISLRGVSYFVFWFRDYHGWEYPDHYILLAWLAWLVNWMVAEAAIGLGLMGYYFKK